MLSAETKATLATIGAVIVLAAIIGGSVLTDGAVIAGLLVVFGITAVVVGIWALFHDYFEARERR